MVIRLISWLSKNPLYNILIVIGYFLAVVLSHQEIGMFINGSFESLSRDAYNLIISGVFLVAGSFFIFQLYRKIRLHNYKRTLIAYLFLSVGLVLFCFNVLFVINIEAIHFLQYAIFAILIFPFTNSAQSSLLLTAIAGALDELYQYIYLSSAAWHYDFNDVFLNIVGAGLGVLVLKILGISTIKYNTAAWYSKIEWQLIFLIVFILGCLFLLGEFSINLIEDDPAFFTLFKRAPDGFWHIPQGPYTKYHILHPFPGLLLSAIVLFLYGRLDNITPIKN